MPKVNPEILVWARETARLELDEAARKLKILSSVEPKTVSMPWKWAKMNRRGQFWLRWRNSTAVPY